MKTFISALTFGATLTAFTFVEAVDAQGVRQPRPNDSERERIIKKCMEMNRKFNTDTYSRNGGREQMYHACMTTHGHHG